MSAHNNHIDSEQLLHISDQVGRIASTLAQLSTSGEAIAPQIAKSAETPDIPVATVRAVIQARRLRARFFDAELFADPAWDMLLDLFEAELCHRRVAVSALGIASMVPASTAVRWINMMNDKGLLSKRADPLDGRRIYVALAPQTSIALRQYFGAIQMPAIG